MACIQKYLLHRIPTGRRIEPVAGIPRSIECDCFGLLLSPTNDSYITSAYVADLVVLNQCENVVDSLYKK
jgi:hypothetical protein